MNYFIDSLFGIDNISAKVNVEIPKMVLYLQVEELSHIQTKVEGAEKEIEGMKSKIKEQENSSEGYYQKT